MTVTTDRIIDLAPAGQFGLIDRYLPDPYRRALTRDADPMSGLTRVTRGALRRALSELEAVQRSRAVAFFNDLSDGALLGALHDQAPWPEDTTDSFRDRLTRVSALAMRGAATADRLLMLAAIACDATRLTSGAGAALFGPGADYGFSVIRKGPDGSENKLTFDGQNEAGQSRRFVAKHDGLAVFPVDVFDAPLRRHDATVVPINGADGQPDRDFRFVLQNPASETLAGLQMDATVKWPDPYFEITAGETAFGPFGFVNMHTAQAIFVNRKIAAGGTLTIDTRQMAWSHEAPGQSALGQLTCLGSKDSVYAGFGLTLDDHVFGQGPLGPLMTLRDKSRVVFTGMKAGAPPTLFDLTDDLDLSLPSFLGEGQSQWRLIELAEDSPKSGDVHAARFRAVAGDADITIKAHWYARRPGEFTLSVPKTALAPDMKGPLPHRDAWLDQMIERFKLGGTVRIPQELLFAQFDGFEETTEIRLASKVRPVDAAVMTDPLEMRDVAHPVDRIGVLAGQSFDVVSNLKLTDAIDVSVTGLTVDVARSITQPTDGVQVRTGLPTDFVSRVGPTDSVSVLPELSFAWRDTLVPRTEVDVTDADNRPDVLRSVVAPGDGAIVRPGLPAAFGSNVAPADTVVVLPELDVALRSDQPRPVDGFDFTDDDVAPDVLRSVGRPGDTVDVTAGLPASFGGIAIPVDTVVVLPELGLTFEGAPNPTDTVVVTDETAVPDPFISPVIPGGTVEVSPGLPASWGATAVPTDTAVFLPEVVFEGRSPTIPDVTVVVTDADIPVAGLVAVVDPTDGIAVTPGPRLLSFPPDPVRPEGGITLRPTFDWSTPVQPTDVIVVDPGSIPDGGGSQIDQPPDDDPPSDDDPVWYGGDDGFGDEPHLDPVPFPWVTGLRRTQPITDILPVPAAVDLTSAAQPTDRIRIVKKRRNRRRFDVNSNLRRR